MRCPLLGRLTHPKKGCHRMGQIQLSRVEFRFIGCFILKREIPSVQRKFSVDVKEAYLNSYFLQVEPLSNCVVSKVTTSVRILHQSGYVINGYNKIKRKIRVDWSNWLHSGDFTSCMNGSLWEDFRTMMPRYHSWEFPFGLASKSVNKRVVRSLWEK